MDQPDNTRTGTALPFIFGEIAYDLISVRGMRAMVRERLAADHTHFRAAAARRDIKGMVALARADAAFPGTLNILNRQEVALLERLRYLDGREPGAWGRVMALVGPPPADDEMGR